MDREVLPMSDTICPKRMDGEPHAWVSTDIDGPKGTTKQGEICLFCRRTRLLPEKK